MILSPVIASMAMLIAQRPDSCSGYVWSRRVRPIVRMAEPPSTRRMPDVAEASMTMEEETRTVLPQTVLPQTVLPDRPSKRKRLSSIAKRWRSHLSSALHRKNKETLVHDELGAGLMSETPTTKEPPSEAPPPEAQEPTAPLGETVIAKRLVLETPTAKEPPLEAPPPEAKEPTAPTEERVVADSSRQSKAAENVDLSGTWKPIVTAQFKADYDEYLRNCSQSFAFRTIAVRGISFQTEIVRQYDNGTNLEIVATNPAGNWNRTLVASESDTPRNYTVVDPDGDEVQVEAWWEQGGTRHKSILRGKPRVQGGAFETVRYMEESEEDVLVCESSFIPDQLSSKKFRFGHVVWRFQRD